MENIKVKELRNIVVRFAGDSGDGMQLTGTILSNISAILGNEISTFPDYPAEIRAPQGTIGGVSGFQVHIGAKNVYTPGDQSDVLVAMNPAALKTNKNTIKQGGVIIYDEDSFGKRDLQKADFETDNPFVELDFSDSISLIPVQLGTLTQESLKDFDLDNKSKSRSKNMFALGLICWLFNRPIDEAIKFLSNKFRKKQSVLEANLKVLTDGFNYGENLHLSVPTYKIERANNPQKGKYTSISGNTATAYGLIAAAEKAGLPLFLGSYPITPASDIMHVLSLRRDLGVKVMQCEDEIAGVTTSIGAAFAGNLAATNTSGPGLALKSEAINLAVMAELPLVIINVMRGGPSTGLPTKTEQTDLLQALYGRNGESPIVVMAASTPDNCFHYTYMAAKLALEYMTPVIILTDAFLGNGTSLWKLPKLEDMPNIKPHFIEQGMEGSSVTRRDEESKIRYWAIPGTEGFEHRNGGLEKDYNEGSISTDGVNHEKMVKTRAKKIANVANTIPNIEIFGEKNADLLVIGWGGTYGHLMTAVSELLAEEKSIALAHFNYINPLPKNSAEILKNHKNIVVCELNNGQFTTYLRNKFDETKFLQYNKVQGQPFAVNELAEHFNTLLK